MREQPVSRRSLVLGALTVCFVILTASFLGDIWGRTPQLVSNPLVDPAFLDTAPPRESYRTILKNDGDLSGFDCYACHERDEPLSLKYDENHILIIPEDHNDITMSHGSHDRNNNCFNCHDETNLERLQTRDGRELTFAESSHLCGSCHGPTYGDWEMGVHGRISGFWKRDLGESTRLDCVDCHDPHSPSQKSRAPAPPPHPLRGGLSTNPDSHE